MAPNDSLLKSTAFGVGLSDELRGGGPVPIGGHKANLSEPLKAVSTQPSYFAAVCATLLGR
jgi:hypothetical protein